MLKDYYFETLADLFVTPVKLPLLVLFGDYLVYFTLLLWVSRFVLLVLLVKLGSLNPHGKPRLNLSFIKHLQCYTDTLLFGVGYHCISLRLPILIPVYLYLIRSCLEVYSNHSRPTSELFKLLISDIGWEAIDVDKSIDFGVVPLLLFLFGSLHYKNIEPV